MATLYVNPSTTDLPVANMGEGARVLAWEHGAQLWRIETPVRPGWVQCSNVWFQDFFDALQAATPPATLSGAQWVTTLPSEAHDWQPVIAGFDRLVVVTPRQDLVSGTWSLPRERWSVQLPSLTDQQCTRLFVNATPHVVRVPAVGAERGSAWPLDAGLDIRGNRVAYGVLEGLRPVEPYLRHHGQNPGEEVLLAVFSEQTGMLEIPPCGICVGDERKIEALQDDGLAQVSYVPGPSHRELWDWLSYWGQAHELVVIASQISAPGLRRLRPDGIRVVVGSPSYGDRVARLPASDPNRHCDALAL